MLHSLYIRDKIGVAFFWIEAANVAASDDNVLSFVSISLTFKTQSLIIIVDGLNNPGSAEILISNLLLKYDDMSLGNINVFHIFPLRE